MGSFHNSCDYGNKIWPNHKQQILENIKYNKEFNEYIYDIIKYFPNDFLNNLKEKQKKEDDLFHSLDINNTSLFDINEREYETLSQNTLKYYDNNEIINYDFIKFFREIENSKIFDETKIKYEECLTI